MEGFDFSYLFITYDLKSITGFLGNISDGPILIKLIINSAERVRQ